MTDAIAIVGMGCRYPDARSPEELWENVLAQRRAFRRLPPERLRLEDYLSADRNAPDSIYSSEAALIEGYEFDRIRFRVAGSTFRSADYAHWLALDVAAQALDDAGFADGEGLPRELTGVFLGNTLTGEFARANLMRLRWPYVRRVVRAALQDEQWPTARLDAFLKRLELAYKEPFPPVGEESLAGGLSNTIAGRISNYFDLNGGCQTVDGACASSLLAVANACSALASGDLDAALAGGVDLSLDPFELVGFAKVGALASELMRVYDVHSNGFWPGEGCGFVLLMRHEEALARQRRVYAVIRGWGISSDGNGGITRPKLEGQLLALRRAYRRAGFGIETVNYFEGHGTGTSVGDAVELMALSHARREAGGTNEPAVIGSIKANIGHTKAAAGVAGLIKAAMAVKGRILPPTTGCIEPHGELKGEAAVLRILNTGEPWPVGRRLRAGISSMGFGGINAHLVLEGRPAASPRTLSYRERALLSAAQDAELFLLEAHSFDELERGVEHLSSFAARLSRAELIDLAAQLERTLEHGQVRAAIVASSPAELAARLRILLSAIECRETRKVDTKSGVFLSAGTQRPRLGYLFTGQGSPSHQDGGVWPLRFEFVRELYAQAQLPTAENGTLTSVAQPAIVTASLAALRVLNRLDIAAELAIGHSLGELTALHWAGAFDEAALIRIAQERGKAMASVDGPTGAMASIGACRAEVEALLNGERVVIAGLNSPSQTVLSGEANEVAIVLARASAKRIATARLPVSHAFHSPLVAAAAPVLARHLSQELIKPLERTVFSTVNGAVLSPETNVGELLCRQITSPVLFMAAATGAEAERIDLWLEVGPGQVLRGLMSQLTSVPVVSLDASGQSLKGLLHAVGAAFVLGQPVNHEALFAGRLTRPFNLDWQPKFFVNPCELAPVSETSAPSNEATPEADVEGVAAATYVVAEGASALDVITDLVAERAELPPAAVSSESRLLSDLHLNSITVGQLVAQAARSLGLPPPVSATDFADATVAEVAEGLERQLHSGQSAQTANDELSPPGLGSWIKPFSVELVERPLARQQMNAASGRWRLFATSDNPLATALQQALESCGTGSGTIVCLPPEPDERHVSLLLEGARSVLAEKEATSFVLVQHGGGAAAFARTLHLEAPQVTTCVVDVPWGSARAVEWIVAEALAAEGYVEAHYDAEGLRRVPVMRALRLAETTTRLDLNADDVLLVTGGGKGITAECALAIARETGARLALLGTARPETDAALADNLRRMDAAGIIFKYVSADVTDASAVRAAVAEVETELGAVTAIIHGAARNVPRLLSQLDEASVGQTLAVKVGGARNLLLAVNPEKLRLLVSFGSIIARTGLPGEADYGLANEWLTRLTEQWQAAHPRCRCLAVEWSIWAGVGMGARLGRIDVLVRQGIIPIPPDEGVSMLFRLLSQPLPIVPVMVMGRLGEMPTFKMEQPELPLLRFLEQPRVYYPNVELVVDVELSTGTDPYLNDHQVQGERLLPAVMGLEAMVQVASALLGSTELPCLQEVMFNRPVVAPEMGALKIRIAALVRETDVVEVALLSEETAFQIEHFRATCRFDGVRPEAIEPAPALSLNGNHQSRTSIIPERDLYGSILFHRGRFRRLSNYRLLKARECMAEIAADGDSAWFSQYLPGTLMLGDPGARDAAIHAVQACIPHATLLPIGVDRISLHPARNDAPLFVHARELEQDGNTFTYDLQLMTADGCVREHWERLRLRAVGSVGQKGQWPASLLSTYLERRVGELIVGAHVSVALEEGTDGARRAQSERTIQAALGEETAIFRRPDGKPETDGKRTVSAAHAGSLTLAVAGVGPLGCDIELVVERSASAWRDLLDEPRAALAELIARDAREDYSTAATRVWCATECLKKAGAGFGAPLLLTAAESDGWVLLSTAGLKLATYAAQVRGHEGRVVIAILVKN